ncbi:AAA family ATPase [Rhodanobacter sp. MP7CTX1]|uniref:ATP-dependent nuclease n=1 Tax=Rhodanobacter sp. MP7CTX1 TaxID=2723084 RepID=UPI0016105F89|nr:AAA family ATPase [Rhodanobacter sp. MP7CTX1]MBB6186675.1 putative ATP-dependent endonuclease of OLD family [Rhodanobacter sp. MP7CTX1]
MHISKLSLVNYRNFANAKLLFQKGINTILGENGSGKTNVFRAIRLLLDDNMIRAAHRLEEMDFHRGLGPWRGHWIIISLEFQNVSSDEAIQSLFLHGTGAIQDDPLEKATYTLIFRPRLDVRTKLSKLPHGNKIALAEILDPLRIEDYETVFMGRSPADFNDPAVYKDVVGDFENVIFNKELDPPQLGSRIPAQLSISKEISFTFVQALRDVVAEFHNNRTNPLLTLLKNKSGEIDPDLFVPIAKQVKDLNDSIEALKDVKAIRTDIAETIKDAAGEAYSPRSLSIRSDLSDEADKLFQSLKLFVGESEESYEGGISELSLGGANLIFLTLKLLEFKYQKAKQSFANFLLIEEPEAHIHTHIQKTLFDRLSYADTQIIYSTHSVHISEVSSVERMNILGREGGTCAVFQPATNLNSVEIATIQRYLDAVRSNLLFARSVLLVEGDAEELLVPIIIKKVLGISLDELGVSLINIRSTGFQNVAMMFHQERIRKRCAILTDLDTSIVDVTPAPGDGKALLSYKEKCAGSQKSGAERKAILEAFQSGNNWLSCHYATHTFEVDFVASGNSEKVVAVVPMVYKDADTIKKAEEDLKSNDVARFGRRVLTMASNKGKGWFALLLGNAIDHQTVVPKYILEALAFANPELGREVWFNVLRHRLRLIKLAGATDQNAMRSFAQHLIAYRSGNVSFVDLRSEMYKAFPEDRINGVLQAY